VLSLTWLVPSVRKPPPEITKKPRRRTFLVQPQEPLPLLLTGIQEKAEAELVPRPEPVRLVSFKEQATVTTVRSPAPVSAPSSPRGRPIPLPRCKSRTVQSGAVSLLPASAPVTPDNSPLSSAETLTESPTEIKRAFSARLTRALPWSRSSTIGSTTTASSSPSSTGVVSEFGESLIAGEKGDGRANVTQRGMFGFLKKTRTIDVRLRGGMLSLFGLLVFNLTLSSQLSVRVAILMYIGQVLYHFLQQLPSHRISCHHPNRFLLLGVQTPPVPYHHTSQSALTDLTSDPNIAA
jgi:hypothetical protein